MTTPELRELLDRRAIDDLLARYCRCLDWLDEDGLATVFWPDAEIDYGFFRGTAEAFLPVVMEMERRSLRRWHAILNPLVAIDGDRAEGECQGLSQGTAERRGELVDTVFAGRYLDAFERRDGEWRIVRRRYVLDWAQSFPNGLAPFRKPGPMSLPVLDVRASGHPDYRRL
jgi:hypothetical protein